jgi:hypothetical protein
LAQENPRKSDPIQSGTKLKKAVEEIDKLGLRQEAGKSDLRAEMSERIRSRVEEKIESTSEEKH